MLTQKNVLSLCILALAGCGVPVWGSGVSAERRLHLDPVRALELQGNIDARVTPGEAGTATLRCDDNLIDHIRAEVDEGELDLRFSPGVMGIPATRCALELHEPGLRRIEVSGSADFVAAGPLPALHEVEVSGSGSVTVGRDGWSVGTAEEEEPAEEGAEDSGGLLSGGEDGGLVEEPAPAEEEEADSAALLSDWSARLPDPADELFVEVSGSGEVFVGGVDASLVDVEISGSGEVGLRGASHELVAEVSGSGEVAARPLSAARLDAEVSGSGGVRATATARAHVEISGSGEVDVWGDPDQRSKDVSGSGEVHWR
ncbi:MAG: DUF2807 domain-containing protein [Deltaproteobacteria bacterium]|jgi:hypothetical protein|nr:DUF2807 domain-containing protein [Deltaproteobacteria bacterium]